MSSKLKSWLLLAVIFVVGIITGSTLTIGLAPHFMHPPGARDMKRHWMRYLTRELSLTTDQQAKIQPIVADAVTRIHSVHRDEVERDSQIFKAADEQISSLLTPGQKMELQKMESDREKRFSDHMRPWDPPHDAPPDMHHHEGPGDGGTPPPPAMPANAAPPPQNP